MAGGLHPGIREKSAHHPHSVLGGVRCFGGRASDVGGKLGGGDRGPWIAAQSTTALLVLSLILLNAAAVTALTSERDSRALDLLLVTDLSPKEIVFGKLLGSFYTAKEMVLLPLALFCFLLYADILPVEKFVFLVVGWAVMTMFAATLGLHAGMTYANSRTAIATSIGTLLFLFLGVATCMRMMLAFSNSFEYQLTSFLGFIAGGGSGCLSRSAGGIRRRPSFGRRSCCRSPRSS